MKKYFKKSLALLLSLIMIISAVPLTASAATYGHLTYEIVNDEVTITDCKTSATTVNIPSTIAGYPVTTIGDSAFYDCSSLTSITIPDSVTTIGGSAFGYCYSLTNITIPDSVTTIEYCAFYKCTNLTSITIPDSVTSIDAGAFSFCGSLTSITIPDSVTSIGDYAFDYCTSLRSITLPDSVTTIGDIAFNNCNSLTSIIVDKNNEYYSSDEDEVLFNKEKTELIQYPIGKDRREYTIPNGITSIGDCAFYNCDNLTSVTIPDSVTTIGNSAFYDCDSLESVTIGDSVTTIGGWAFSSCNSLKSVTIGESVTTIGYDAFYNCKSLESITIPDSVTTIGGSAFYGCDSLASITILNPDCEIYDSGDTIRKNTIIYGYAGSTAEAYAEKYNREFVALEEASEIVASGECGENVTWKLDAEGTLTISGTGDMYNYDTSPWYDDGYNEKIKKVVVENGITSIGIGVFAYCENLTDVSIPKGVTSIGDLAFAFCENLTAVSIPEGVTTIGMGAFAYCENLAEVSIPASVSTIGAAVFTNCYKIEKVAIAENNKYYSTDENALFNKDKTELVSFFGNTDTYIIPDGVIAICNNAFTSCDSLTNIIIPDSVTYIGYETFVNCTNLASITLPENMTSIGIFKDCTSLKSIIIPDGITAINDYCFENCKSLESITIAESVTYIGYDAFVGCENLANITILGTIKEAHDSLYDTKCYSNSNNWDNGVLYVDNHIFAVKENELPETYTISLGTKSICSYIFSSCFQLKSIIIPDSVTYIGMWAFNNSEIESIFIHNPDCEIYDGDTIQKNTIIYGYAGSTAEAYAEKYGNTFIEIVKECEHKYKTVVTAPTCTEQGFTTYTCEECGDTYVADYVDATGHDYVEIITTPATHTKEGLKTFTCNCGDSYTETIEKLEEHTYTPEITEPTCTEGGYTTYTCACGDTYTDNRTEPLRHDIVDSVCTRCGYKIDVQVTIGTVTGRPGETVDVYVSLNGITDVKTMAISDIVYDSSKLTLVGGEWLTEGIITDWNLKDEVGVITFKENKELNGNIFVFSFEIKENLEDAETEINCTFGIKAMNENNIETALTVEVIPGAVKIVNVIKGDVNGDEFTDSNDAIHLLYHTMLPDRYEINQDCDFDGDGYVNSNDAIYLLYHTMLPERYPL